MRPKRWLEIPAAIVAAAVLLTIAATRTSDAMPYPPEFTCDAIFVTNVGPPLMAQPDGTIQTLTRDCTNGFVCSDYFDVMLQEGDDLTLSTCADGGTANFNTSIAVFSGFGFQTLEQCAQSGCASVRADTTFTAPATGTYRVRIGREGFLFFNDLGGGIYTLAYSAPLGSTIIPASCGNGVIGAGEACDDGNDVDGDCCSSSCQLDPAGGACVDDGIDCTDDVCDGAGACTHPIAAAGRACAGDGNICTDDVCDGAGACTHPAKPPPCMLEPVCGAQRPASTAQFEHPKSAKSFKTSLVQAFRACANPGGGVPNTASEGGIPACDVRTLNEVAGEPAGAWHWNAEKAQGTVEIGAVCKGAADLRLVLKLSGIVDDVGNPADGRGTLAFQFDLTTNDPVAGDVSAFIVPVELAFSMVGGSATVKTTVDAVWSEAGFPPLPNGTSASLDGMFDYYGVEVRDPNGTSFARPGLFLP